MQVTIPAQEIHLLDRICRAGTSHRKSFGRTNERFAPAFSQWLDLGIDQSHDCFPELAWLKDTKLIGAPVAVDVAS